MYQVLDTATQRKLALKQLLATHAGERLEQADRLFEQEFCTLAQLAHPRVVEVYDFGREEARPYYTMELLDGGDLRDLTPVGWQKACSLLADICSVLSLLHSRRLVYRDLSARNVRCTQDLKAKLIDFGAMVPMGPCKHAIGTPAFIAPEVVALQELDARADLYSLGAVLYFALTGVAAYPARNFSALRDAWRSRPRPPSHFAAGIPPELDDLVLSLVDLDPVARPANAAEVTEKLSAIAGLKLDDQLLVSKAYLSTPTMVGRRVDILRVRKRVLNALRHRGATVLIEGPPGVGRTRFLDACVLEAKVAGATVLKADAGDAQAGNWGMARALATHLVDELPQLALQTAEPHLPVLGHLLPHLLAKCDGATLRIFDDPQQLRPSLQAALCDWLLEVTHSHFLMIAVDDIHHVDEPSTALIARLSREVSNKKMVLAVATETDAPATAPGAMKMLQQAGGRIKLKNLAPEQTERLLGSVFGETPNVRLLADRLQGISQGNPRAIMQLAQHLVDKDLVRYGAGAWTLPSHIDAGDLPDSLAETFKAKAATLSPNARSLAQTMALTPAQNLSFEECLILSERNDKGVLLQDLNELVTSSVVSTDGQYYCLAQQGWVSPLLDGVHKDAERAFHLKIAEVFSQRGSNGLRVAMHLFAAGEQDRGLDVLIHDAESSQKNLAQNTDAFYEYINSLPPNWLDIYNRALGLCQELGRPRKQGFLLQMSLIRFSILAGLEDRGILHDATDQLVQDSGLAFYDELGESVEADARIWRALELAQQRYDATPESERVLPPGEAIPELANAISYVMGTASNAHDYGMVEAMPSLEPLEPLSPALGVVNRVLNAGRHMLSARHEQAMQEMQGILDRIAQPDRAGLDDMIHRITHFSWALGLGMTEASFGLRSSLKWAAEIEQDPLHQVNAWQIRMVYHLRQGNSEKAEKCKKRVEMLRIQNSPAQHFGDTIAFPQLLAYGLADDLLRVKGVIEEIERVARRFRTWMPTLHFARGEYQRIRGDHRNALDEFARALNLIAPGRHIVWPHVAGAHLRALFELERFSEGETIGEQNLLAAQQEDIRYDSSFIQMPLALIQAKLGKHEAAIHNAEAVIERFHAVGTTGLNLGLAYEARAYVAILLGDDERFDHYARLCAEQYHAGRNPALTAKYEKLVQQARRATFGVTDGLAHAVDVSDDGTQSVSSVVIDALTDCQGPQDRVELALEVLVRQSNCLGGFLYTVQKDAPVLCCQTGSCAPPIEMDAVVRQYVQAEMDDCSDVTATVADLGAGSAARFEWKNDRGQEYCPVLLGHGTDDGFSITGVAVLLPDPGKEFVLPIEFAAIVSKALSEAGDVAAVPTASSV